MTILEKTAAGMEELGIDTENPMMRNVLSWYAEHCDRDAAPCSMCCDRHREPTMYPTLLPTFHVFTGTPREETEQDRICSECRGQMQAAEAEYAKALCRILGGSGTPASEAEMLLVLEAYEKCMDECERIGTEHEEKLKTAMAAEA